MAERRRASDNVARVELRAAIQRRGMSLETAAARIGLERNELWRYLEGRVVPKINVAMAIETEFGVGLRLWAQKQNGVNHGQERRKQVGGPLDERAEVGGARHEGQGERTAAGDRDQ